jgi:hypothetical protein
MRRYKVSFPFQLKPKPVPLTSWVHSTDSEGNFVLHLWRNKYWRPLAMGGERAKPHRALWRNYSP